VDVPVPRPAAGREAAGREAAGREAAGREAMRYWRRDSCLWTLQTIHVEHDPVANQTTRFLRYDKWQDGTLRMTELQTFRLQNWSSQEFEDLLAEAGFTGTLVTADYNDADVAGPAGGIWTFHAAAPRAR
jgi:hypothetical protein